MSNPLRQYIEQHMDEFVADLQAFLRIPSVSAQGGQPILDAAEWLKQRMEKAGISVQVFSVDGGHPVIYGEIQGEGDETLLNYNHYDVQPPDPLEEWHSDPFAAEIRDGVLYARGVADNKGSLLSRIHAVEAYKAVYGKLPVTVKFLFEGEEEIGSPNLAAFVEAHKDLLRANACIWENAYKDDHGRPTMRLGNKGMCYVELRCRVANIDSHSSLATIYPNAAWRLVWALSTFKDQNENILIEGFYDDVVPPSEADIEALKRIPANVEEQKARMGIPQLLSGDDELETNKRLYFYPTCTIAGIGSGYLGPNSKTVNPAYAFAKVDMRLVANQDPDDILAKVKAHLKKHGFDDIEVVSYTHSWPMRTPVDNGFVQVVNAAGRRVYGQEMVILPSSPGTGPRYVFRHVRDTMPIVALGVGHAGSQQHAPNENIKLQDYAEAVHHVAEILAEAAKSGLNPPTNGR